MTAHDLRINASCSSVKFTVPSGRAIAILILNLVSRILTYDLVFALDDKTVQSLIIYIGGGKLKIVWIELTIYMHDASALEAGCIFALWKKGRAGKEYEAMLEGRFLSR
jgi:hypothetical protein